MVSGVHVLLLSFGSLVLELDGKNGFPELVCVVVVLSLHPRWCDGPLECVGNGC